VAKVTDSFDFTDGFLMAEGSVQVLYEISLPSTDIFSN
jgi:hypothetical protein